MPPAARKVSTAKATQPAKKAAQPAKKAAQPAKKVTQPAKRVTQPAPAVTDKAKPTTAAASITLPFLSASLTLPGPGAAVKVGPLGVSMPTGYLYYAGLGVLAVAGTIEWPVAAALGAGGFVVKRIRNSNTSRSRAVKPTHGPARSAGARPSKAT